MVLTQRRGKQDKKKQETLKQEEARRGITEEKITPKYYGTEESKKIGDVAVLPRIILVVVLIAGFCYTRDYILLNYYMEEKEVEFGVVGSKYAKKQMAVECSNDYEKKFSGCVPRKCGRNIMDGVISASEVAKLVNIARKGMKHGGSAGGPTILDLHSGALSLGEKFVNVYTLAQHGEFEAFTKEDFEVYKTVKNKIKATIAKEYGVRKSKLYLTKPTFFSRITSKPAKTEHDEYWHAHVDKTTYGSFDYTSLLYLSDYNKNFTGGRFVFVDSKTNYTVDPRAGRLSFFTSGSENLHRVEKVTSGERFAITVSFTCDKEHAISDPMQQ